MVPYLRAETAALQNLRASGVLLEAFSPGGPGAVPVLDAAGADAARDVASALPLHQAKLIGAEIIELHPFHFR
jgi:hypothetical protein